MAKLGPPKEITVFTIQCSDGITRKYCELWPDNYGDGYTAYQVSDQNIIGGMLHRITRSEYNTATTAKETVRELGTKK